MSYILLGGHVISIVRLYSFISLSWSCYVRVYRSWDGILFFMNDNRNMMV